MITVKNLCKNFNSIKALNNINFTVRRGEIVALLGPNGAGKSTLMSLLSGCIDPTAGEIEIFKQNYNNSRRQILSKLGYVPENAPLYGEMTVFEFLKFMAVAGGLSSTEAGKKIAEFTRQFELSDVLTQKCETLSKGFKRRVAIAGTLTSSPRILILDEPAEGLDPNQKFSLRQFLKDYAQKNIVIISTHIMEEVTALSSRVLLLNRGKLIKDTTAALLSELSPDNSLETAFRNITRQNNKSGEYNAQTD